MKNKNGEVKRNRYRDGKKSYSSYEKSNMSDESSEDLVFKCENESKKGKNKAFEKTVAGLNKIVIKM